MTEECKLCGGLEAVTIVVPHGGLDKDTEYSDCPCCIERIWTADEAKLKARIAELERQLVESRDYAISEAAKIRTEYEAQQAALVKALKYIAKNYIGTARCVAQQALGAVKPAGQEGGAKATSMLCDADARIAELERQQNVLVDRLLGASNYIDRLGGNSAVFRQSLVAVKGETP